MRYLQIDVGPWSNEKPSWWIRLLQKILPAANPDIEHLYEKAQIWWLEIDDTGVPQREIGFGPEMTPIVLGPIGNNFGFLVDSSDEWVDSKDDSIEAANCFHATWETLWPEFKHLET